MPDTPENFDDAKGQVKEKAGDVTDDGSLKREGKEDQAAGKAKSALGSAKDKADDAIDGVRDRIQDRS